MHTNRNRKVRRVAPTLRSGSLSTTVMPAALKAAGVLGKQIRIVQPEFDQDGFTMALQGLAMKFAKNQMDEQTASLEQLAPRYNSSADMLAWSYELLATGQADNIEKALHLYLEAMKHDDIHPIIASFTSMNEEAIAAGVAPKEVLALEVAEDEFSDDEEGDDDTGEMDDLGDDEEDVADDDNSASDLTNNDGNEDTSEDEMSDEDSEDEDDAVAEDEAACIKKVMAALASESDDEGDEDNEVEDDLDSLKTESTLARKHAKAKNVLTTAKANAGTKEIASLKKALLRTGS